MTSDSYGRLLLTAIHVHILTHTQILTQIHANISTTMTALQFRQMAVMAKGVLAYARALQLWLLLLLLLPRVEKSINRP